MGAQGGGGFTNQSINQSSKQSINQSINQSKLMIQGLAMVLPINNGN